MKTIYTVIESGRGADYEFKERISCLLNEGWKLAGGISITYGAHGAGMFMAQALTKDIDESGVPK